MTSDIAIARDDPRRADVVRLLEGHAALMESLSPPGSCHYFDVEALCVPAVTFWSARENDTLLGCGALYAHETADGEKTLGEIKSMHTLERARGRGVGQMLLDAIVAEAKRRGYERLSLETGSPEGFGAAQRLYARNGFERCGPFADYADDPFSLFMTRAL